MDGGGAGDARVATQDEFSKAYSDSGFWAKLKRYARAAGREVVGKALLLYYALQEDDAPAWAKATIIGALGYFITLVDAIPDITPAVGYTDDLGVLVMALAAVSTYINDNVRARAERKLAEWFGETTPDAATNEPDSEGKTGAASDREVTAPKP